MEKLFFAARIRHSVLYAKNVFLGSQKSCFSGITFSRWKWGKMIKVKFIAHLMPEIEMPNLSGSKNYHSGFAPIENWSGMDPYFSGMDPYFTIPLGPVKLKNGHFWMFLDFWSNKKYEMLKSKAAILKSYRSAFQRYKIYQDWTVFHWVMAQRVVKNPKSLS